jgi:hypothetical protein
MMIFAPTTDGYARRATASGTCEKYGLGGIGSAFEVKPDIGPLFTEVRV